MDKDTHIQLADIFVFIILFITQFIHATSNKIRTAIQTDFYGPINLTLMEML